ncbi:hypothetical protein FB451DRAFT_1165872 [Mycena latifolia]|nr:hypothetical protein FB451DRAFT_1165872 [Mycena latifolia]
MSSPFLPYHLNSLTDFLRDTLKALCHDIQFHWKETEGGTLAKKVTGHMTTGSKNPADGMPERVSHWLQGQKVQRANRSCPNCKNSLVSITTIDEKPPYFFVNVPKEGVLLDQILNLTVAGGKHLYMLRGVVYTANNHFTSRILNPDGAVWYHDGIETQRYALSEGNVHDHFKRFLNTVERKDVVQVATSLIYVSVED